MLALFVLRSVLPAPGTSLPYPALLDWSSRRDMDLTRLDHRDQSMVVSVVSRNAAILTTEPWNLLAGFGQCAPMPRSYTLGEHMFGTSFLAALPYLLTRDPILSFNVALVLTLWIPALTMFALSYRFTRNPAAAFVAGMLFMLVPGRVVDPSHPYVHGDLWVPLVILFLHRLFVYRRWADALLFALFVSLEVFESLYPLLSCSMIVLVYGSYLALRHWRSLPALLPKIAVASALVLLAAFVVLGPYLETRETWGLLEGRTSILMNLSDYGWGSIYFPGVMILALGALGLADRMRGPRRVAGEDPRLAIFASGVLILWGSTVGIPVPFTGIVVPSPIELLKPIVPGLNAVRALNAIGISANLAWAFLAGYGIVWLIERRRQAVAVTVAAAATAATVLFLYDGRFAKPMSSVWSFKLDAWHASPPAQDVELIRRVGEGAVLDVPFPQMDTPSAAHLARHLLLNAYDPRATAACYNSFASPVQVQIAQLSAGLPHHEAADALAALGFATVIIDKVRFDPSALQSFFDGLRNLDNAERLHPVGKTGRLLAYRLSTPTPVRHDFALLAGSTAPPLTVAGAGGAVVPIELVFANNGREIFRLPDPIAPSDLVVRWRDGTGRVVRETAVRELLPMAVAPGARFAVTFRVPAPERAGRYQVAVTRAEEPERVLAQRTVELRAASR